jgi:hypothetical protein
MLVSEPNHKQVFLQRTLNIRRSRDEDLCRSGVSQTRDANKKKCHCEKGTQHTRQIARYKLHDQNRHR